MIRWLKRNWLPVLLMIVGAALYGYAVWHVTTGGTP